jgi:6-pyruvoyltetrahydropterin/6-carboxytetrahydropterin synthase
VYEIYKEAKFEAAHQIVGHEIDGEPGKCARPHGHSYTIAVCIRAEYLMPIGFAADFYYVGALLKELVAAWDHQDLNHLEPFVSGINTTAENIARIVFDRVSERIESMVMDGKTADCAYVYYAECRETAGTYSRYYDPEEV